MSLSDFKLLTKADAAAVFGVCTKTIDNYIREGRLPPPVAFASREYWHPEEFKAFLDLTFRRVQPPQTSETASAENSVVTKEYEAPGMQKLRAPARAARDSNPAVRQQSRQQAKLRMLNARA